MGRLVRQGCKGADVRAIQDVLNFLPCAGSRSANS